MFEPYFIIFLFGWLDPFWGLQARGVIALVDGLSLFPWLAFSCAARPMDAVASPGVHYRVVLVGMAPEGMYRSREGGGADGI